MKTEMDYLIEQARKSLEENSGKIYRDYMNNIYRKIKTKYEVGKIKIPDGDINSNFILMLAFMKSSIEKIEE